MEVYFDNAATTQIDIQVIDKMSEIMKNVFGNASAIHAQGRKAKAVVEMARKNIAKLINCESSEIIFTGSGTEADNMALRCAANDLGVKCIITSKIEHKAVLDTAIELDTNNIAKVHFVKLDNLGRTNLDDLEKLAGQNPGALISIMHANNEIGTLNNIQEISKIARANKCYFHTDTIQTLGHYTMDIKALDVDFVTCSAHKFHGPKGCGFLYKNKSLKIRPIVTGGGQESKMRAGTENVMGIAGLAKALEVSNSNIDVKIDTVTRIKQYFIKQLRKKIPGVDFNGDITPKGGLYTVLNVSLPPTDKASTLLFQLDINHISASGGSACNSGAISDSHVLQGINHPKDRSAIRFSFSKFSKKEEVDYAIAKLIEILELEI